MKSNENIKIALVCIGLVGLGIFYHLKPLAWYLKRNPFLVDEETGKIIEPVNFIKLDRLIKQDDTYLNATSPIEKLFDLIQQVSYQRLHHSDQFYASEQDLIVSSWPVGNQTKCSHQLNSTLAYLNAHPAFQFERGKQNHQIAKYLDSFGKPSSSMFSGSNHLVGSYDECMASKLQLDDDQDAIQMRYCWSRWTFNKWPSEHRLMQPKSQISFGACLPESCDSRAIKNNKQVIKELITRDWNDFYKSNLQLNELFCLPDERSPLRQMPAWSYVYLGLIAVWTVLIISAIIWKAVRRYKLDLGDGISWTNRNVILSTLSVGKAVKKFASNPFGDNSLSENQQVVNLGFLSFLKVIMYIIVIFGHAMFIFFLSGGLSVGSYIRSANSSMATWNMAVFRLMDTFFIIYGLLASYNSCKYFTGKNRQNFRTIWFGFVVKSFLRMMPLYLLVIGFITLIIPYTNAGPWWDYGISGYQSRLSMCRSQPWYHQILMSFRLPGSDSWNACLSPSWFLANYLAWSFFCPILIWALVRLPNESWRVAFCTLLNLLPSLRMGDNVLKQRSIGFEPVIAHGSWETLLFAKYQGIKEYDIYDSMGQVVAGCYVGYLLYKYQMGEIKRWPRLLYNRYFLALIGVLNLVVFSAPFLAGLDYQLRGGPMSKLELAGLNFILMFLWPICNCIVMICVATVFAKNSFVRFCNHPFWHVFNKLGFCMYLIHWDIIFWSYSINDHAPSYGTTLDILERASFGYLASVVVSFVLYIFYESPMNELLTRVILKRITS